MMELATLFTDNHQLTTTTESTTLNVTSYENYSLFYVPTSLVVLLSVVYGSVSAITVIGNTLVILVIATNRRMQTVTNFFISNLSVADVMIGCLSIPFQFQAALLQRWDLPDVLCTVAPFVKELSVNVSVATLTVIAIDRYFAVVQPLKPNCTSRTAAMVVVVTWLIGAISSLPTAIAFRVSWISNSDTSDQMNEDGDSTNSPKANTTKPFCYPSFPKIGDTDTSVMYASYLMVMQYFLPLIIICFAYSRVMYSIWIARTPGSAVDGRDRIINKNKRKVIKMLVIVVALFAFCWLPIQLYNLLTMLAPNINNYKYINIIWFCCNWLAMSNSCYNPFIYGLVNEKFKNGFRLLFRRSPCRMMCHLASPVPGDDQFSTSSFRLRSRSTINNEYYSVRCSSSYGHRQQQQQQQRQQHRLKSIVA